MKATLDMFRRASMPLFMSAVASITIAFSGCASDHCAPSRTARRGSYPDSFDKHTLLGRINTGYNNAFDNVPIVDWHPFGFMDPARDGEPNFSIGKQKDYKDPSDRVNMSVTVYNSGYIFNPNPR